MVKLANISPVYKAEDLLDKTNDRPVGVLPLLSKIFLCKLLRDLTKSHSTQNALFRLLQSWKKVLDNSRYAGEGLMCLSKAYECIPHDILEVYGLDKTSLY